MNLVFIFMINNEILYNFIKPIITVLEDVTYEIIKQQQYSEHWCNA